MLEIPHPANGIRNDKCEWEKQGKIAFHPERSEGSHILFRVLHSTSDYKYI